MRCSVARRLGMVAVVTMLSACANQGDVKQSSEGSGFLRNYATLQETSNAQGKIVRAWLNPRFTPANYNAIILDPLVFYPEPKPSEQVSAEELNRMLAYANNGLRQQLSQRFKVVDRPGPGVARIRVAVSSVAAKGEGLKPYQYVPIVYVATMAARAATGSPSLRQFIVVESEATDSVSGELLGERVRTATGENLPTGVNVITLETMKPTLDELTSQAFPELSRFVKPR